MMANMTHDEIEITDEFEDYSFIIEEIITEIEDKERLRAELLKDLRERIFDNIQFR